MVLNMISRYKFGWKLYILVLAENGCESADLGSESGPNVLRSV